MLPLKIPNALFSEHSLFVSDPALGCCSGFLSQQKLPEQMGEAGLPDSSRLTPEVRTFIHSPIFAELPFLSSTGNNSCLYPLLPRLNPPPQTPETIQGVWFLLSGGCHILLLAIESFSNSKFF